MFRSALTTSCVLLLFVMVPTPLRTFAHCCAVFSYISYTALLRVIIFRSVSAQRLTVQMTHSSCIKCIKLRSNPQPCQATLLNRHVLVLPEDIVSDTTPSTGSTMIVALIIHAHESRPRISPCFTTKIVVWSHASWYRFS
ncbi:hypothetical protein OE88DRAFT_352594 [Heliocybe sulcata]|uniref:Secreted protein n=1 Tax=Heliocybe sulcata TaxID=5364 RepID=A0A5C3N6Z8_9AGAM|nr:hypothetical protein OE88DRAFT_352594 [Heliocybe sulcata]